MKATKSGYLIEEITTLGLSWRGVAMAPDLWRFIGDVLKVCVFNKTLIGKEGIHLGGEKYN